MTVIAKNILGKLTLNKEGTHYYYNYVCPSRDYIYKSCGYASKSLALLDAESKALGFGFTVEEILAKTLTLSSEMVASLHTALDCLRNHTSEQRDIAAYYIEQFLKFK